VDAFVASPDANNPRRGAWLFSQALDIEGAHAMNCRNISLAVLTMLPPSRDSRRESSSVAVPYGYEDARRNGFEIEQFTDISPVSGDA